MSETDVLLSAAKEIERLQGIIAELEAEVVERRARKLALDERDQRREELLRECLQWLDKFGTPTSAMGFNAIDDLIHRIRCVTAA